MEAILFNPETHEHHISSLVNLHAACVHSDNMIATFLPPLDLEALRLWWADRISEVAVGSRDIAVVLPPDDENTVAAVAMLYKPFSQTGPFRGTVEKLMVSPDFRRKGLARLVMAKVEEVALEAKRTLLVS